MTDTTELRRLALEEAQSAFPDKVPPSSSWSEMDAHELKMALILLSLELLSEPENGKHQTLSKLLEAISVAENEDPQQKVASIQFFEKHGVDNDQFWDENIHLTPEEKLMHAIFGRKQRPRFYFEVENFALHLEESRANEFRQSI
jgi:hypothetical protein